MIRLVVVGSANVDFVVKTPHIPAPGETVLGRDFVMAMGGKGANQAVGAARLGALVTFVARVGRDVFGDQCLAAYAAEGIDTRFVTRDDHEATGVALIAVAEGGENSITVASGANMQLTVAHVEAAASAFDQADALLLQLEVPLDTVIAAARMARERGVKTVLNPAPAQRLPRDLLALVDVITPNRIELAQMLQEPVHEVEVLTHAQLAEAVLRLGVPGGVVTLGADGALAAGSWGWTHVAPFRVEAVDTTAAGDAFNAGLVVALARGMALDQAVRYGSACGALAATRMGAQPSLPRVSEVEALLSK